MINLLDGLRDLKAPLASGLIILFGFWLIFANEVASADPGQSLAGNIHQLVDFLGGPATLGLVAFIGYLLGLVLSLQLFTMWVFVVMKGAHRSKFAPSWRDIAYEIRMFLKEHGKLLPRLTPRSSQSDLRIESFLDNYVNEAVTQRGWSRAEMIRITDPDIVLLNPNYEPGAYDSEAFHHAKITSHLKLLIIHELDLLAVQLHADREKIYEKYEKNKTESDFRAAIVLPLLFVATVLMVRFLSESQPLPGVAVIIVAAMAAVRLSAGAHERLVEANDAVLNALRLGHIKSPRLKIFEEKYRPGKPEDFII